MALCVILWLIEIHATPKFMLHPRTAARRGAIRALVEIEVSEVPLGAALGRQQLAAEARGFANEIATGTVRQRAWLDYTLAPLLKKPLRALDAPVRSALRLAAYERCLLHTPAAAVGDEYAGLMRGEKLSSAVAFVNAVARRLPTEPRPAPDAESHPIAHLATQYSHPEWLVERWLARFGFVDCQALCEANNQIAPLSLRANTLRTTRDAVLEKLLGRGLAARPGALSPHAIIVEHAGDPTGWPEWEAGLILAQDEAAQLVALLAAPQPGQIVIDAAAAPGGKSTHLAQLMQDKGQVLACDVAPGRLKLVQENAQRLGLHSIAVHAGDFRTVAGALAPADLVLLDAPCLGTGTWRRRPDAKWRKTPAQLNELVALQRELLDTAASVVKPGGALVYATCSLEPEENQEQVFRWLSLHSAWTLEPAAATVDPMLHTTMTADGCLQTLPHRHGCDGMFAAKLRRTDTVSS